MFGAVSHRVQAAGGDSLGHQVVLHRFGAAQRELLVVWRAALGVGVAGDDEPVFTEACRVERDFQLGELCGGLRCQGAGIRIKRHIQVHRLLVLRRVPPRQPARGELAGRGGCMMQCLLDLLTGQHRVGRRRGRVFRQSTHRRSERHESGDGGEKGSSHGYHLIGSSPMERRVELYLSLAASSLVCDVWRAVPGAAACNSIKASKYCARARCNASAESAGSGSIFKSPACTDFDSRPVAALPTAEPTTSLFLPMMSANAKRAFFSDSDSVTATSILTGMNSSGARGKS